jgi:predicted acetyltransferase
MYSELVWTSEPKTLEEHMAQYFDNTHHNFEYWVETAREIITRLNNGEQAHDIIYIIIEPHFMGELATRWNLQKFLTPVDEPQLVAGNPTINYI